MFCSYPKPCRIKAIAVIAVLLCCRPALLPADEPQAAETAGPQLRMLSYNIRHGRGMDDRIDLERIAAVIRSVSPDLVALQEVDRKVMRSGVVDQPAELARLTDMQVAFGGNIDLQGGHYGNALLSRFPITEQQNRLLPRIDASEQRGVLIASFDAPPPFAGLTLLATHLDYRPDPRERLAGVEVLNQLLADRGGAPTLLAGDLNATPDSETLARLAPHWQVTNEGELPTVPASAPRRQIDFILTAPQDRWQVIETRVLDEPVASDHRPIFSVLQWKLTPPTTEVR